VTSPEAHGQLLEDYYTSYLHRFTNENDRAVWVGVLQQGVPDQNVIAAIIASPAHQLLE